MTNFNAKVSRFAIVLINHGKSITDLDAEFKHFSVRLRCDRAQIKAEELEKEYNMRCCVLVNEG